jgi:glucose-6-phosphate-specific signal transduction histidine kinase
MSVFPGGSAGSPHDPWFRQHPRIALAVAGLLFASVLSLRMFAGEPVDASTFLFTLPVALVAVAFGLRAGVAAGVLAVVIIVGWVVITGTTLTPVGWVARLLPELLLGFLLGDASDRLRRADEERRRLESAALLYREAIEINDSLVQGMAAARWALEAGRTEAGLQTLEDTIGQAQELVSDLIRQAGMAGPTSSLPSG